MIQPPIRDFYRTAIRTLPIGLAYLAGSLSAHGHEVEILDCQTRRKSHVPLPPELSYLREFYPFQDQSPFKLYTGYYHFGMDWGEIRERIQGSGADVFGISSSFTPYHGEALTVARIVKEWNSGKIVVMGGAHVSGDPESVLKSPVIDYAVMGEGEIRLPLLLNQIASGKAIQDLDGIGYRVQGDARIVPLRRFIQDLDSIPFPARGLLDPDRYRIQKKRSTMMVTSRGCPHGCAYCSAHLGMGRGFRARSPESVIDEMLDCRRNSGIEVFDIEDDNFTYDPGRAKDLLRRVTETFGEGGIELTAMNGISFASLDEELLALMKKAGFRTINLSYVSTDASIRDRMRRPSPPLSFKRILKEAERNGLCVIAYAILGMPGQTIPDMVDTLMDLMGMRVLIGPSVYYPTPGTALFQQCRGEGWLPDSSLQWRSSAFPIETEAFNRLDLLTLFRLTRLINFIKGKMDQGMLEEGLSWEEMVRILRGPFQNEMRFDWRRLLQKMIEGKTFVSLRKGGPEEGVLIKEPTSRRVWDFFFDQAAGKPILKSQGTPLKGGCSEGSCFSRQPESGERGQRGPEASAG